MVNSADEEFEKITKSEEDIVKEKLKTKWARLEALAGTESRLKRIAQDIVHHFNNREVEGKAMIVCMSRRIAVKMYELLKQIQNAPETAVVITRPEDFGLPRTTKQDREDLKARFKDPDDPLKFVIVRDMWLTGFDAPVLHTMKRGSSKKYDYECVRNGTTNIFMAIEFKGGKRVTRITKRRTMTDFALFARGQRISGRQSYPIGHR